MNTTVVRLILRRTVDACDILYICNRATFGTIRKRPWLRAGATCKQLTRDSTSQADPEKDQNN